jgi:hypothetical protein
MTHVAAAIDALRFHEASTDKLARIPDAARQQFLRDLDTAQLTLALGARCPGALPSWLRTRIDRDLANNATRYGRLLATCREIDEALRARGIDYLLLKGLSQSLDYVDDPRHRPQYDIDIYVPDDSITAASAAMRETGYQPAGITEDPGADHLPVLIHKTGWSWRGDYFDPDMPPSLEIHFRFWNAAHLGFDAPGVMAFWRRRTTSRIGDFAFPALNRVDALTYASLHLLRHLLFGDLKSRHVYEIAYFLERSSANDEFWEQWRESALPSCRTLEAIAFRLARDSFHCQLHPTAAEAVGGLPAAIQRWFALFGDGRRSGKNELWLHLCLVDDRRVRWRIMLRRMFPTRRSRVVKSPHLPDSGARIAHLAWEASFLVRRAVHHVKALAPTIRGGWLWYAGRRTPT